MGHHRLDTCLFLFHLSLQAVWGLNKVVFQNPQGEPLPDYPLRVSYSCDEPVIVLLECIVFFDTGKMSTVLRRHWGCEPGPTRVRTMILQLPDWLVYQPDWLVPHSQWVHSGMLRVSLCKYGSEYRHGSSFARDVAVLLPTNPLSRPLKQHKLCLDWGDHILSRINTMPQCPVEQETVHLLSSIYASTGENHGIMKTLHPYGSEVLEYLRLKAVFFPWFALSIWVFLTQYCEQKYCGLFHHINSRNNYTSPTLLLTDSGQLHIQMHGGSVLSSAFLCSFKVPLDQWCDITMELRGRKVDVTMVCLDGKQKSIYSTDHMFTHSIELDDTDGFVVIGGGQYVRGIQGFYGPLVYYRNRIPPMSTSELIVPEPITKINLTGWLQSCKHFQSELRVKINTYLHTKRKKQSDICMGAYCKWRLRLPQPSMPQCASWESPSAPRRHRALQLAESLASKHGGGEVVLAAVGRVLYSLSVRRLGQGRTAGVVSKTIPLLQQSGCLGDNHALHLASVIFNNGLGVSALPNKALQLSLLGAQRDSRLALLHLGHLHHLGEPGITPDPDLAYAYYSNIAKQTSLDRQNPSHQQTFVESVYLNNEKALSLQTNENHHLFHWLKLQARNGAADAEQAVARMLFWGQQGVSPDIHTAVRHYERGAVSLEDPVSMYDYAIVLLQGHGVKKDIPRAITFLKKSVDKGFTPAMNALGWYYEQLKDYQRSVELWEQADAEGNPDAPMNLGVMYSRGLYPGRAADQLMAFQYYLKSAQRGHVGGAIELAEMWTTGIPGHIQRRPTDAVLWAKWVAEHNGYLGMVLRKALVSYFKGDMFMSLSYYLMAAESGYGPAQFNVAYLCEHNTGGFLKPAFVAQCMRRYYNQTIHSQKPDPYALIRMGDLLYEGHEGRRGNVAAAAEMYKRAALRNDPQGWYSLGLLAQEDHRLPLPVLAGLGLAELYVAENTVLVPTFYRRCRDSNSSDSYLPCSLALFNAYMQSFRKGYTDTLRFTGSVALAVTAPPILLILAVLWGRGTHHL